MVLNAVYLEEGHELPPVFLNMRDREEGNEFQPDDDYEYFSMYSFNEADLLNQWRLPGFRDTPRHSLASPSI